MTTVGELLDRLATQPRDRKVILSCDGNAPLENAEEALWAQGGLYMLSAKPIDAERVVVLTGFGD